MSKIMRGFLLLGCFGLWACNTAPKPTIITQQPQVLVKDPSVAFMIKESSIIFDVRPSFEAQGVKVPTSIAMSPSDLGLRPYLVQNNYSDIQGVLRRHGVKQNSSVILIGDSSRDLSSMGYVGLILWSFGVTSVDATDFNHWRVRPVEISSGVKEAQVTDLFTEPKEIEIDRSELDNQCRGKKCICVTHDVKKLPRRTLMACDPLEIAGKMFWTDKKIFKLSAWENLNKMGLNRDQTVYIPWDKDNYFTAWAMLRLGYKVKIVRLGNIKN